MALCCHCPQHRWKRGDGVCFRLFRHSARWQPFRSPLVRPAPTKLIGVDADLPHSLDGRLLPLTSSGADSSGS